MARYNPARSARACWDAFRACVEVEHGGTVVEPEWLGNHRKHRVICAAGHECAPYPANVQRGHGPCRTCSWGSAAAAWAAFRACVEVEHGGTVVEPEWLGSHRKHRVICAAGHACAPRPAGVQQGRGICPKCAGKVWDQFYVVLSPSTGVAKLGITSGDPRDRLRDHRRAGFAEVIRLVEVEGALDLERAALDACRYGGYAPLKGREYFDVIALPTILDVVDHWPS